MYFVTIEVETYKNNPHLSLIELDSITAFKSPKNFGFLKFRRHNPIFVKERVPKRAEITPKIICYMLAQYFSYPVLVAFSLGKNSKSNRYLFSQITFPIAYRIYHTHRG